MSKPIFISKAWATWWTDALVRLARRWRRRGAVRSPLAALLMSRIFALYFVAALVVTLLQAWSQYGDELKVLQSEVAATVKLMEPALAKALWDIDRPGTQAIVDGLSTHKSLVGLRLEGLGPEAIARGQTPQPPTGSSGSASQDAGRWPSRLYEQQFLIRHPDSERADQVEGRLSVYVSSGLVLERSLSVMVTIAVSAAVKTLALWVILYFTIRGTVARPLTRLAEGLNRINQENAGTPPSQQTAARVRQPDEMKFLWQSFLSMRRALRQFHRKLLLQQSRLEEQVVSRTRQLHDMAMRDSLTGLLNRRALGSVISEGGPSPMDAKALHVFSLIDLDHFKLVNDTFGHAAGDQLLKQVADLLRRHSREHDLVVRLGGDEFAVVMWQCTLDEAKSKMSYLSARVSEISFHDEGRHVSIGMSAGLAAFSTQDVENLELIMERADAACYAAKAAGRHQVRVFRENPQSAQRKHDVNWVSVIQHALENDHFVLYAQPIHAAEDRSIQRVEVLIRMRLEGSIARPDLFMPPAERFGLSTQIDEWVVEKTLRFMADHPEFVKRVGVVQINLSASAVASPQFYRFITSQIRRHRPLPGTLCFEVTEQVAIRRLDDAVRIMNGLRRRGVTFSLDDFGHGASSYTYLQTLPVDQVKINGSFVSSLHNPVSRAIVKSIADIARLAGMSTVAEYVDSEDIARELRELRVDYLQGFLLSQPTPMVDLMAALTGKTVSE